MHVCLTMQWVNGVEVVSHSGGHLPFEANITDLVKTGAPNRITVAINNTLTPHTLPPGTLTHGGPPNLPEGFVSLNYQFDFYNYAGRSPIASVQKLNHLISIVLIPQVVDGLQNITEYDVSKVFYFT